MPGCHAPPKMTTITDADEPAIRAAHYALLDKVRAQNGAAGCRRFSTSGVCPPVLRSSCSAALQAPCWSTSIGYDAGALHPGMTATRDRGWEERASFCSVCLVIISDDRAGRAHDINCRRTALQAANAAHQHAAHHLHYGPLPVSPLGEHRVAAARMRFCVRWLAPSQPTGLAYGV